MKLTLELENIDDVKVAVATLMRGFPQAFAPEEPKPEASAPIVNANGEPATADAPTIVNANGEPVTPLKKRGRPAASKEAVNNPPTGPKLEDVRAAARSVKGADGMPDLEKVRGVLATLGAARIDAIKPEQFADAIQKFQQAAQG